MFSKLIAGISLGIFLSIQTLSGAQDSKNFDPKNATDLELQEKAKKELGAPKAKPKSNQRSAVNDVEVLRLPPQNYKQKSWRLGLDLQAYSFSGSLETSLNESFSLSQSGAAPMLGVEACRKIYTPTSYLNLDACLGFAYARQTVNLAMSSGVTLSEVELQAILPHSRLSLDWKPIRRWPMYIGSFLGGGSYFLTHRSDEGLANSSSIAGLYSLGASTRLEIGSVSFLQASYVFRDLFLADSNQSIQPHNFVASAGIVF